MDPYTRHYLLFATSSVGPLLAVMVAWSVRRRGQSASGVAIFAGAVLISLAHLLFYWWNVPGTGSFVDGRPYELALAVAVSHFVVTQVGQVLFFGGLLVQLRGRRPTVLGLP
jgi:hypothetical protein